MLITVVMGRSVFFESPIPNVSALTVAQNLGLYWDKNCTQSISSIDWGALSPGDLKEVDVYVRNEGNTSVILSLTSLNWNPVNASSYMNFTWNIVDTKLDLSQVAPANLTLTVSPSITGISNFRFDIVVQAKQYFVGDINRDGSVNALDLGLLGKALGSIPTDANWAPSADLNNDGRIDFLDLILLFRNFGKS